MTPCRPRLTGRRSRLEDGKLHLSLLLPYVVFFSRLNDLPFLTGCRAASVLVLHDPGPDGRSRRNLSSDPP